jgi:hypothetical protein
LGEKGNLNMGGIGSGTYRKFKLKATTEDFYSLDLRKLTKLVPIDQNCQFTLEWRNQDNVNAAIDCRVIDDVLELHYSIYKDIERVSAVDYVSIIKTPCNFGGVRRWLRCPACKKRALILYIVNRFHCRKCQNLYHPSSNEGSLFRATRALCNEQNKLNGKHLKPMDGISGISKPKWMRYKTYNTLKEEALVSEKKFREEYRRAFDSAFV